jgi:hypothetical protein
MRAIAHGFAAKLALDLKEGDEIETSIAGRRDGP